MDFADASFSPFSGSDEEHGGEVFHGFLAGRDAAKVASDPRMVAVVAFPGYAEDVYAGKIAADGKVSLQTVNVYGKRDMVSEIMGQGSDLECHLEVYDPFIGVESKDIPALKLSQAIHPVLSRRNRFVRSERTLVADTLYEYMPKRESLLLADANCTSYHLDDYTRFPSFREIVVEIIPELRVRTVRGIPSLLLTYSDALGQRTDVTDDILVMMDGVVLTDLNLLLDFDAMLIEDIDIYDEAFLCGKTPFFGLVNIITKKNYVTALHFPANVRVLDFQGVAYPVAYNGAVPKGEGQDLRQLLYWHPLLQVDAASDYRIEFTTPGYAGRFKVVAEGFTEDGKPVYQTFTFEVE